jgi:hypothetical protein
MSAASRSIVLADTLGRPGVPSVGARLISTDGGGRLAASSKPPECCGDQSWSRFQGRKKPFGVDALLLPSRAFRHPLDVVRDTDMTVDEKRLRRGRPMHVRSSPIPRWGLPIRGMSSIMTTSSMRRSCLMPGRGHGDLRVQGAGHGADDGATGKTGARQRKLQCVRFLDGRARLTSQLGRLV